MNWLSMLWQALMGALSKPATSAHEPAQPPPLPGFAAIDAAEDARLARERSSVEPVTKP